MGGNAGGGFMLTVSMANFSLQTPLKPKTVRPTTNEARQLVCSSNERGRWNPCEAIPASVDQHRSTIGQHRLPRRAHAAHWRRSLPYSLLQWSTVNSLSNFLWVFLGFSGELERASRRIAAACRSN